jgi:hypothetical protein
MFRWTLRQENDKLERERIDDTGHMRDGSDSEPCAVWVVGRVVTLSLAAALIGGFGLIVPAAEQLADQPQAVRVYALTPERIAASLAAVAGLIAAVTGGLALTRSARPIGAGNGRRGAIVALITGPIGFAIGGLVVATADGGVGTGNGLAGGVVAMVVGLAGIALGGLALTRSGRAA